MPGQNTAEALKGFPHEASTLGLGAGGTYSITGASQTITIDASLGYAHEILCTTTDAFTVAAPTGMFIGQVMEVKFKNTSGGTMGTPTFNAVFKTGTFTKPANGFNRVLRFRWNGTNWWQHTDASDVAN